MTLFQSFVEGQSRLAQLSAEEQDTERMALLERLCGKDRYKPNGFSGTDPAQFAQMDPWKQELVQMARDDVGTNKNHVFTKRPETTPKILWVMTACKRLDLFMRTMFSFLTHCRDCSLISDWVVLDDGSSEEDLEIMRKTFPFINVVSKGKLGLPKGHAHSLNFLWWSLGVDKGFDYIFQIEDDWQFFRSDNYITRCLSADRDQVLINRLYAETVFCLCSIGGWWDQKAGCWEHDHLNPEPRAAALMQAQNAVHGDHYGSHNYWPGFSLRPGLLKVSSIKGVTPFRTDGQHFEMDFAKRWTGKTAYLPEISSWHIGRLTSERHGNDHVLNAYELNGVNQFGGTCEAKSEDPSPADVSPPVPAQSNSIPAPKDSIVGSITHRALHEQFYKLGADRISLDRYNKPAHPFPTDFEVWVVNLDRRKDRLEKFSQRNGPALQGTKVMRLPATDGKLSEPNHHWDRLASYGDFHHHRGMMACAKSHMRLWEHLARHTGGIEWIIVLEDDVVLAPDFRDRIQSEIACRMAEAHWDRWNLIWLGFHPTPHSPLWGVNFGVPGKANTLRGEVNSSNDIQSAQYVSVQPWDLRTSCRQSMGGTHAYMLHKRGAQNLLAHLGKNGMRNGIDWEMWHCPGTFAVLPPIAHAPSPAVHTLLPEQSDTDIQITAMNPKVSVFPAKIEARPLLRERDHMYTLLRMRTSDVVPTVAHVPISKWLAQHPSLLHEWAKQESWFWQEHDVVWFQLQDSAEDQTRNVNHPQRDQPLLHTLAKVAGQEFGTDVDWMCLSNNSVVAILSPESFDGDQINEYFCMGAQQVDRAWLRS